MNRQPNQTETESPIILPSNEQEPAIDPVHFDRRNAPRPFGRTKKPSVKNAAEPTHAAAPNIAAVRELRA